MKVEENKSEPRVVRGTPVETLDSKRGKVFTVSYVPNLRYAWDTGEGIGRYLAELKQGCLIARRCHGCERILIPPRMFCERCFRPTNEWVRVRDTGTVNTFSLCYVTWDVKRLKRPEVPSVIEIDGASPGMGILHVVKGVRPREMRVGLKVKAVWKPAGKRIGSITDISHWKPISLRGSRLKG
jgi:uncharacterized OB-fold protein